MARRRLTPMERIQSSILDEAVKVITIWGMDQIDTHAPQILDSVLDLVQKLPNSVKKKTHEYKEARIAKKLQYQKGKELSKQEMSSIYIQSMKDAGLNEEQISCVLSYAAELETNGSKSVNPHKPRIKIPRIKKRGAD